MQLFADRARAANPGFKDAAKYEPALTALCERLEGIPLAIELAAARASVFSPAEILKRLSQRFKLLTNRRAGRRDRHRSLWAVMEWSYRLLPVALRRFFAHLSIFRSGWTLEAAVQVCGETLSDNLEQEPDSEAAHSPEIPDDELNVADALAQLREHSLIQCEDGEPMRFRLLETVREFAAAQLEPKERERLAWRHAEYFRQWTKTSYQTMQPPDILRQLTAAQADLRAAFDFLLKRGEVEEAASMTFRLIDFWSRRASEREGREWMERVLQREDALSHWRRYEMWAGAGRLALGMGDLTAAQSFYEQALTIAHKEQHPKKVAEISGFLGTLAHAKGNYQQAERYCDDALAHWRQSGNQLGIAWTLAQKADSLYAQGDLTQARAVYEEALALQRELGNALSIAHLLYRLSDLHATTGDCVTARALLEESLTIRRQQEDQVGVAECLRELGLLAKDRGDFAQARALLEESLDIVRPLNKPEFVASLRSCLSLTASCEGKLAEARALEEENLTFWRQRGHPRWIGGILRQLATIALHEGKPAEARVLCEESLALYQQVGDGLGTADTQSLSGRIQLELGDHARAATLLREALTAQAHAGVRPAVVRSLEGLAHMAAAQGDADRAARLLGAAEAQREILDYCLPPVERPARDRLLAAMRKALGKAAFASARAEGYRMTLDEAVACGME